MTKSPLDLLRTILTLIDDSSNGLSPQGNQSSSSTESSLPSQQNSMDVDDFGTNSYDSEFVEDWERMEEDDISDPESCGADISYVSNVSTLIAQCPRFVPVTSVLKGRARICHSPNCSKATATMFVLHSNFKYCSNACVTYYLNFKDIVLVSQENERIRNEDKPKPAKPILLQLEEKAEFLLPLIPAEYLCIFSDASLHLVFVDTENNGKWTLDKFSALSSLHLFNVHFFPLFSVSTKTRCKDASEKVQRYSAGIRGM